MKAVCWHGVGDMRVENVPDPTILNPQDAIIKVTTTCICGSDLHLMNGMVPGMVSGDIVGHEFMGEVVETGREVHKVAVGDRVVVPFLISCGRCEFCKKGLFSACDNTNPNAEVVAKLYGMGSSAGMFGYSHTFGGYAGGQAEYVRVPFADVGPMKIPQGLSDEKVVFLTDILPTAYQAAEFCGIERGDVVAVWGCGPVGLLAQTCARLLGAERIIAIDREPYRLDMAREHNLAETINICEDDVSERIIELTGGRGADRCIDAVGCEATGCSAGAFYDQIKVKVKLATDRIDALREAIYNCRKGGTVSIPGVYVGVADKFPIGAAFGKGLTFRMGQTHVQHYLEPLLERIERDEIDPTYIITHRAGLDDAPALYKTFRDKKDQCTKVVLSA